MELFGLFGWFCFCFFGKSFSLFLEHHKHLGSPCFLQPQPAPWENQGKEVLADRSFKCSWVHIQNVENVQVNMWDKQ